MVGYRMWVSVHTVCLNTRELVVTRGGVAATATTHLSYDLAFQTLVRVPRWVAFISCGSPRVQIAPLRTLCWMDAVFIASV